MIGLFKRGTTRAGPDLATLGASALALAVPAGTVVPAGCAGLAFDKGGRTRRFCAGQRIEIGAHEQGACYHPGPYSTDLVPFASSPELGLHLRFAVADADPRVTQQRFDLYLASEAADGMPLVALCDALEAALQRELAQGNLDLPPCTSADEWEAFRSGLDQLLYVRFGLAIDDCLPVDLADSVDYAQLLLARAAPPAAEATGTERAPPATQDDAHALRRLFLELPCVTAALRQLTPAPSWFRRHQDLLLRLAQLNLSITTMPALALAAPGRGLSAPAQALRSGHTIEALGALDEAWALLARVSSGAGPDIALEDAERIVANLEHHCAARRAAP